jgi:uncharacterized protein involved in exopolysaccharide biosynthesis
MEGFVSPSHPDFKQAETELSALQAQLRRFQAKAEGQLDGSGYAERYRDFKYNQVLYELVVQQFEIARLDEAREGALIQVIDRALVPERKTSPRRAQSVALTSVIVFVLLAVAVAVPRDVFRSLQAGV